MKRILFLLVGIAVALAPLSAIDIRFTPPIFVGSGAGGEAAALADYLTKEFADIFTEFQEDLAKDFAGIDKYPSDMVKAFGNASVFASDGASNRAHRGYNLFSVTAGSIIGFQLPSSPFKIADEIDDIANRLEKDGDINLGINPQVLNVQVGINTSRFLLENLYLGIKVGYFNMAMEPMEFNTLALGLTANYQFLPRANIAGGIVQWRGVNFGTGIMFQRTSMDISLELDPIVDESLKIEASAYPALGLGYDRTITTTVTPTITMGLSQTTVTIPLEALTSVRLLWFLNVHAGLGVDLAFGSSKLEASSSSVISMSGLPQGGSYTLTQQRPAKLDVVMEGSENPRFLNLKFMTGVGFSLGPVVIDIPVTFYIGNGYNAGLTIGVVW